MIPRMAATSARPGNLLRRLRERPGPVFSSRAPRVPPPHRVAPGDRVLFNQLANALADAAATHASGRLVDIGCGRKPWAPTFAPYVTEHIGVDQEEPTSPDHGQVDIVGDAYDVPLDNDSADTVLLTELLIHLAEPVKALQEAYRLLRPGGGIIVTTPMLIPITTHPHDYFRYSPYGLDHVLRQAGFEEVAVQPLSGQWTTLASLRSLALYPYRQNRFLSAIIDAYSVLSLEIAVRLDEADFREVFSWNHIATARKP
jgi:ubiquinone/menaquinone biosynthesis C-methylase UbiE